MTTPLAHLRFLARALLLALLAVLCLPTASASAATPPLAATHVNVGATYTGWAYLRGDGASVPLWRWSAAGWQAATMPAGTAVWSAPWGGGWTWVWGSGAWHAVQTGSVAVWSCTAVAGDPSLAVAAGGAALRPRSSTGASATRQLAGGERLALACANGFPDADSTRFATHALVRAADGATGYVEVTRLAAANAAPSTGLGAWAVPFGSRPASGAISLHDCHDVVIANRTFRNLGANVAAIRIQNCQRVTVEAVDLIDVAEGIYAVDSSDIVVRDVRYSNILGPSERVGINRGNLVQLDKVQRAQVVHNKGRGGDTEDIVSVFKSNDVLVERNHFEGVGWRSQSGSGIALGDGGGSGNVARLNVLVNPGQVGIFISGGVGNQITDNVIIGQQRPSSNVGIYVWEQGGVACSGHAVARNRVLWYRADGGANPFWNGGNCGAIAMAGNTFGDTTLNIDAWRVTI